MARQTLRAVIDRVVQRTWEAGAQAALIHQGVHAPEAHRRVQSDRDPVWKASRDDSLRRQQRLAREDIHRALEALIVETERQLRHDGPALKAKS